MIGNITAELAIKLAIIQDSEYAITEEELVHLDVEELTGVVEEIFDDHHDDLYDMLCEWREVGEDTNLPAPHSRHYETDQVAAPTPFGWVSWTYWYGGGKHGNPQEIDWLEDAFFVDVEEKEVTVTQRTFTRKSGD